RMNWMISGTLRITSTGTATSQLIGRLCSRNQPTTHPMTVPAAPATTARKMVRRPPSRMNQRSDHCRPAYGVSENCMASVPENTPGGGQGAKADRLGNHVIHARGHQEKFECPEGLGLRHLGRAGQFPQTNHHAQRGIQQGPVHLVHKREEDNPEQLREYDMGKALE